MTDLTPLAKALICAFGIFVIVLNLALVGLFMRRKGANEHKAVRMQKQFKDIVRNPWSDEDRQWQELSRRVEPYKKPPSEED